MQGFEGREGRRVEERQPTGRRRQGILGGLGVLRTTSQFCSEERSCEPGLELMEALAPSLVGAPGSWPTDVP